MNISEGQKKAYLMIGGTFLPAFLGVIALATYNKQLKVNGTSILVFAGLSALGGYFTSKIIETKN